MSLGLGCYDSSGSEEDDQLPPPPKLKPKKQPVKIMAPSATTSISSDEEEAPLSKKPKKAVKNRSGLFAKLPPPRNSIGGGKTTNRPLIPYVFQKAKTDAKPKPPSKINAQNQSKASATVSSDEEESVDFFTYLDKKEIPESVSQDSEVTVKNVNKLELPPPTINIANVLSTEDPTITPVSNAEPENIHTNSQSNNLDSWIDSKAMQRIQGKKHRNEKFEFIDVNQDDRLEGNKELLLKTISEEKSLNRQSHSKKRNGDMPSAQHKRKHQMSYLIHQARAREVELKNSWASGKEKRDGARMRYGF